MSCGCNDIYTCHAELIHAYAEIQQVDIPFTASDWRGLNYLKIMPCTVSGPNEIGPHTLPKRGYSITVLKAMGLGVFRIVETSNIIDTTTGIITIWKSSGVSPFSGRVEVR